MGKILIVTGQEATNLVNKNVQHLDDVEVLTLPISIAAFINENLLRNALQSIQIDQFEFILIPGLVKGSFEKVENEFGIPIFKGPRYAADIPLAIKMRDKLSKKKAADYAFIERDLEEIEKILRQPVEGSNFFALGNNNYSIKIGKNLFPLIIAEIVDAPKRSLDEIINLSKYYIESGANIIDIGAEVKISQPKKIYEIIKHLKSDKIFQDVPISIDSLNENEILSGIDAGAELILSIDSGNINILDNISRDLALVILPTNVKKGYMPKSPQKRVEELNLNINTARDKGFNKIIGDPLLESPIYPGIFKSMTSYSIFREKDDQTPLMFGIGNVTELIDADTAGVNALMASIGIELGVNVYLTTEYSVKSRFSVKELSMALKLSYLARKRKTPPKDMPLNLLYAKSKSTNPPPIDIKGKEIIHFETEIEIFHPDHLGFFQIWVDHRIKKIFVAHFINKSEINKIFTGTSAEIIGKKIISLNLCSNTYHALYLGKELQKAEICLNLGKSYVQDIKFGEL
ncbi:MAG: dihydropteroate synthase-like protein [Candidatus Lokiarchaeota archaeon]|nr:dihydropteroate synthase-like protein [Candidatus Lokiarchaeota archaeon]